MVIYNNMQALPIFNLGLRMDSFNSGIESYLGVI